jgi:hypothetical protein
VQRMQGTTTARVWVGQKQYPGLSVSRSLGDFQAHQVGVSALPEVRSPKNKSTNNAIQSFTPQVGALFDC